MSPGKQASRAGPPHRQPAGARLEAMGRRVRLTPGSLTAIAAGPVALGLAVTSSPISVQAATAPASAAVRALRRQPPIPEASRRCSSARGCAAAPTMRPVRRPVLRSHCAGRRPAGPGVRCAGEAESVVAVRSAQRSGSAWSVTVAAQYADSVRYYAVPVVLDRTGGSFTVTGAPGWLPARPGPRCPGVAVAGECSDGDLTSAVGEFFAAYLTGAGEVDRYLAPGMTLSAVSLLPYTAAAG